MDAFRSARKQLGFERQECDAKLQDLVEFEREFPFYSPPTNRKESRGRRLYHHLVV